MAERAILVFALGLVAACASGTDPGETGAVDKTQAVVLNCPDGWARCVSTANQICGPRGFDEVDRAQDTYVSASGRLDERTDGRGVYREDVRIDQQNQVMVIRCR